MSVDTMHPTLTRTQAMMLAADLRSGGWSLRGIQDALALNGVVIRSTETILRWTDPAYAEVKRQEKRRRERDRQRRLHPGSRWRTITDAARMDRLRDLRKVGLTPAATAKVLTLDFGVPMSRNQVSHAEKTGRYPTLPAKARA